MINIMFLLVLCLVTITSHSVNGNEDLELERHLNLINKPPVKSIHTKFGYIVDCIDINKQPAFDHPLLKNHTLQRQPKFYIKKEKISVKNSPTIFGIDEVECPTETVPIRRITKDDLNRTKSLWKDNIFATAVRHFAGVSLKVQPGERFYAITGTTNAYNFKLSIGQASSSHVYIQSGDGTNKILVGWHVSPHIYGDDKTHIFVAWTKDNFENTGCYNVQCKGFVQIESHYYAGAAIQTTSTYGRGPMVDIPIEIFLESGLWWVSMNHFAVGYFPATLFANLNGAEVGWSGGTIAIGAPNPPMGSGHFPDDDFTHSGYFINMGYKNALRQAYIGPAKSSVNENTDAPNCYRVKYNDNSHFGGHALQFGGPGGNC